MKLLAYEMHPKVTRPVFLRELRSHEKQDRYIHGDYYKENGIWRGCAVGCALKTVSLRTGDDIGKSDHASYEKYLGIPVRLAFLEDKIFEGLKGAPGDAAKKWPLQFASAIRKGADLSEVYPQFQVWNMREFLKPYYGDSKWGVEAACEAVAKYWSMSAIERESPQGLSAAWSAAESAWSAESARLAAESAASAAWSARLAAESAASAAWSAWSAAESARLAAESAAYQKMADKLVELLKAA